MWQLFTLYLLEMCIMCWALVGCDHLVLVSFFWLWTLPGHANKNMSGWNMSPTGKTEKRTDVTVDQPKTGHPIKKQAAKLWSKTNNKQSRALSPETPLLLAPQNKLTNFPMEIVGVLKRQDETPSSNVHLMTPFEDQQGFSTAQGLRTYQGCVVSN